MRVSARLCIEDRGRTLVCLWQGHLRHFPGTASAVFLQMPHPPPASVSPAPGGARGLFLYHDAWTCWLVLSGRGPSHSLLSKFTSLSSGLTHTTAATGYRYHHTHLQKSLEIPRVDDFLGASILQGLGATSSLEQAPGPIPPCSPNTLVSSVSPVTRGTDA